jgi:hypothetical protein
MYLVVTLSGRSSAAAVFPTGTPLSAIAPKIREIVITRREAEDD